MSTAEWDAVDPLGGILNSDWEERQERERDAARQPALRRAYTCVVTWLKEDAPNMSIDDIRLDVDPGEKPEKLSEQQQRDIQGSIEAGRHLTPNRSDFYKDLLRPVKPGDHSDRRD